MENFRTVTIVGKMYTYEGAYIKYFLRWIGIECVYVDEQDEVDKKSDIILVFGNKKNVFKKIDDELGEENLYFVVDFNQKAEKILSDVVSLFIERNSKLSCMEDLRKIYEEKHLIEIFYEYTGVNLLNLSDDTVGNYMKILYDAEAKVEELIKVTEEFKEAVIFSKYYLIEKINKFKWILRKKNIKYGVYFDAEDCLNQVNEVYNYDKKYWQVEILKAGFASYDDRFTSLSKFFYENTLMNCSLKQSESENWYLIGVLKEKNGEYYERDVSFQRAYAIDNKNVKALFKLMYIHRKLEHDGLAFDFANDILKILKPKYEEKEKMNLLYIEDLYKVYGNLERVCEEQFIEIYKKMKKTVLDYMESLKESENDFASKMYPDNKVKIQIVKGMVFRCCSIKRDENTEN